MGCRDKTGGAEQCTLRATVDSIYTSFRLPPLQGGGRGGSLHTVLRLNKFLRVWVPLQLLIQLVAGQVIVASFILQDTTNPGWSGYCSPLDLAESNQS